MECADHASPTDLTRNVTQFSTGSFGAAVGASISISQTERSAANVSYLQMDMFYSTHRAAPHLPRAPTGTDAPPRKDAPVDAVLHRRLVF